jgi:adenine-specific DNA methylase
VEIHEASAQSALCELAAYSAEVHIRVQDFFDAEPSELCDVVVGNPPYVRYQDFDGEARAKSLRAALSQGVRLSGLASSWAAFTVHAASHLKPSGRLGLVLPAELLTVKYAAEVRRFLLRRFSSVKLVTFEQLVFPDVQEDVVLLLAEGSGGASHFEVYQAKNLDDLESSATAEWVGFAPADAEQKWTSALLPGRALQVYRSLLEGESFSRLVDWGSTYLGAVTGSNQYFTLSRDEALALGIPEKELLPISPPGSKHLRGLTFERAAWEALVKEGKRCFLFAPADKPSSAAKRYIKAGEEKSVHTGYKCSVRSPWWQVPLVRKPDLFFTYMNHEHPRLITNGADAQLLNSLYGINLKSELKDLGRSLLPIACLNSVTLLGAEVVGRAYGGGMLKHEPREADELPVLAIATLGAVADELRAIAPQVGGALRGGGLSKAVDMVDAIILERHLKLAASDIQKLKAARDYLFRRRATRNRGERVAP